MGARLSGESEGAEGIVVIQVGFKFRTERVICRFSCGAASAVATKLAIEKYGKVEIYYNETGSHHADNLRMMDDCSRWFGQEIEVLRSQNFKDTWEVFEERQYLVGHNGAPCTSELKRIPGDSVWQFGDVEIFGYTADEAGRVQRFQEDNPERIIESPLIAKGITKADCLKAVTAVGIALPTMYLLGFRNNNCIACVKARDSIDYWKRTRKYFPDEFWRMAKLERKFNFAINRVTVNGVRTAVFLDEIEPGDPKGVDQSVACGLFCGTDEKETV